MQHSLSLPAGMARHLLVALIGVLGFTLLVAAPAGAQTPDPSATASATAGATASATATGTPFVVTDEGVQQLLKLLRKRMLPAPARITLAALLEQQGVSNETLTRLIEKPRHCEDGKAKDGDHEKRCLEVPATPVAPIAIGADACEQALAATTEATAKKQGELREKLAERCAKWLKEDRARALAFCERVKTAATRPPGDLKEFCAKVLATPVASLAAFASPSALCMAALTAGPEDAPKLAEKCAGALKSSPEFASAICAQVAQSMASGAPTKGAKALTEVCQKLTKPVATAPAVSPAVACEQALAANGEDAGKLAEKCAAGLKSNPQLANSVCAPLLSSMWAATPSTQTKGARALAEYCLKLAGKAITTPPKEKL